MEKVIYVSVINPCFGCMCYDPDVGCTMPANDIWYGCPLEPRPIEEDFEKIKGE